MSEDESKVKAWLGDTRTWRDGIYAVKSYDYLEIVVRGGVPAWDKVKECWVDKDTLSDDNNSATDTSTDDLESELTMGSSSSSLTTDDTTVSTPATVGADDDDDDLPF